MAAGPLPLTPASAPAGAATAPAVLSWRTHRLSLDKIVAGFFLAATGALLAGVGGGGVANMAFTGIAALTGLIYYARSPTAYVSFTLWLWFVTPFVRRVLDLQHGWSPASPVLLAPLTVALLSAVTVLRRLNDLRGRLYAPYLLVLTALVYGYAVGIINAGVVPATYALLTWLAPVLFGVHVALNWRRYPQLGSSVRTTFLWALPILAAYGVYQFVKMPAWDAAWMINSDLKSIGSPRPFLARVFGTLNTPGPYAAFLCAGALMLLPTKGKLRFVSIGLAMVSLLLARTRAVWVAFLIGMALQQVGQPLRRMPKYVITLMLVALIAIPVASMPRFSAMIAPRLASFRNLSEDNSFVKRYNFGEAAAASIVETAEGNGLGTTGGAIKLRGNQGVRALDNGFLEVFFIFGWPGGALFFLGIGALLFQSSRFREARNDPFANSVRATAAALVSILPIGDVFTGPTGTLLWMSAGFGIAGHAYHMTTGAALRSHALRRALAAASAAVIPAPAAPGTAPVPAHDAGALPVAGAVAVPTPRRA
jgi:hypothetical protein